MEAKQEGHAVIWVAFGLGALIGATLATVIVGAFATNAIDFERDEAFEQGRQAGLHGDPDTQLGRVS